MTLPDPGGDGNAEITDFTIRREPHRFRIDDDIFSAPPIIGGWMLKQIGALRGRLGDVTSDTLADGDDGAAERAVTLVADMFKLLLPGPSGKRFAERLLSDGNPGDPDADPPVPPSPPPIDIVRQAMPVMNWLLERYGLRPTVPSSPSPTGSTDGETGTPSDGISSTDGASPAAIETTSATPQPTG